MKDRIKLVRQSAGLSQTDFGKAVGVSLSSVQKWESGQNIPTPQVQYVICDKFGISCHWLETGEGDMIDPRVESDIELLTRTMEGQSEAKKRLVRFVATMPPDLAQAFCEYLDEYIKKSQA